MRKRPAAACEAPSHGAVVKGRNRSHSRRLTLMVMCGTVQSWSLREGEYVRGGLRGALFDAECFRDSYEAGRGETHVAVVVFPVKLGNPSRVIARYPVRSSLLEERQ